MCDVPECNEDNEIACCSCPSVVCWDQMNSTCNELDRSIVRQLVNQLMIHFILLLLVLKNQSERLHKSVLQKKTRKVLDTMKTAGQG